MRKNLIRTLVAVLLIFSVMGTTAYAESASVTGTAVNLREGPGTGYRILDTLSAGTVVEVTDRSNGAWYAVSYGGRSGYMSSGYLQMLGAAEQATVIYSEPAFSSAPAEGEAVIIMDGVSPTVQSGGTASVVIGSGAPAATAAPAAPAATVAPAAPAASSAAVVTTQPAVNDYTPDEGTAVIILGDNTIVLPASSPAKSTEASPPDTSNVGKTGYINGDFVSFRSSPSASASIISSYNKGKELVITGTASGDWTPCRIDNQNGYVYTRYITLSEQYLAAISGQSSAVANPPAASSGSANTASGGTSASQSGSAQSGNAYITGNNVRFRSGPSMNAGIIGEFFYGNSVTVTGTSGDWTAVNYNGKSGYVYSQYVKSGSFPAGSNSGTSAGTNTGSAVKAPASTGSATGQQIADYALQFVGCRYVWGGTSPETGFDCSGFVQYVYKQFGYQLNRVACDQARNGEHVDSANIQPGDVLCFYSSANYIGHTGIYIGNNKFVHASTSTTGVIISELNGYYFTRGYEARRIV